MTKEFILRYLLTLTKYGISYSDWSDRAKVPFFLTDLHIYGIKPLGILSNIVVGIPTFIRSKVIFLLANHFYIPHTIHSIDFSNLKE